MQPSAAGSSELTRHACEPCRKKKSKCTGEKPICSFCQRLKANCFYLPRKPNAARGHAISRGWKRSGHSGVVRQTAQPNARKELQHTSLQIEERRRYLPEPPSFHPETEAQTDYPVTPSQDGISGTQGWEQPPVGPESTESAIAEPPQEVLEFFVDVYEAKLHFQPLPLLPLENLTDQLLSGPRFLLWSFISLILTIADHEFYQDSKELVARTAEDAVMRLAFEGVPKPTVMQSLCLIAMKHIRTYQPARASMTVGAASRLFTIQYSFNGGANCPFQGDECVSRAFWSICIFESLFSSSVPGLLDARPPPYPDTEVQPPPPAPPVVPDRLPTLESNQDIGITASCIRIVSTWGKLGSYLHRLRQAEVEKPWLPSSTHTKLSLELLEFESQYNRKHLLNNVGLATRTALEVSQQRDYWNPWMTTQIVWHAAQAILNHPFLHLVVLRSQDEIPQSCLFLQQKVEMALYHAGWLFRIIRMSTGIMSIFDPMIGVAVAATATVQWLFQFSVDTRVARRAQDDLCWCDEFLSHMALTWPHFSHSLIVLRKLQDLADHNRRDIINQDATIKFKSAWIWELLDTGIWKSSTDDVSSLHAVAGMRDDFDTSMCLKSHFIDPFREEQHMSQEQQSLDSGINHLDSRFMGTEGLEQFRIDELSLNFLNSAFEI
ncbi:hypothetical protein FOVG_19172 [Fusarium oxysporum f. sp. pisi HDV247]|uniref:Zn(2)-C6 fungal-type domain-containing protein n=1 Tax=Fusarium oxysporum f. sp. pisi HDV247 TaxID=1080344 RepID=W9NF48_FUSOX|nr:hypothetical protein FOVG_19172 [Fusarium oxysporum f. sp. pisi HDV247]